MTILITNAIIVNEGRSFNSDILIKDQIIAKIGKDLSGLSADRVIDADGITLLSEIMKNVKNIL